MKRPLMTRFRNTPAFGNVAIYWPGSIWRWLYLLPSMLWRGWWPHRGSSMMGYERGFRLVREDKGR